MLFDFQSYISELRNKDNKKDSIEDYEKYYGPIKGDIYSQNWYIDYVSKFSEFYKQFKFPLELSDDFDWLLLFNLAAASFSNDTTYLIPNKTFVDFDSEVEFQINVVSGDKKVSKKVSELWGFNILRLYEIYVEEQIKLQTLIAESASEAISILEQRIKKYNDYKAYSERLLHFDREETPAQTNHNLLFHYTSVKTIDLIIKSKCLWLTDVTKLNDRNEQKIWYQIFEKVIEKYISKEDYDEYREIIYAVETKVKSYKNYDSFIASFSTKEDLLSQWRAYGDDGEGICIVFKAREFLDLLYNDEGNDSLLQGNLDYDYQKVYEDTYKIVFEVVKHFNIKKVSLSEYMNMIDCVEFFNEKCKEIWMRIQDSKDSSFFEENEFRLFWHQLKDKPLKPVDTFERNKRIVPYIKLNMRGGQIPIEKIIIGPACREPEDLRSGIERLLRNNGYEIGENTICFSKVPYRK